MDADRSHGHFGFARAPNKRPSTKPTPNIGSSLAWATLDPLPVSSTRSPLVVTLVIWLIILTTLILGDFNDGHNMMVLGQYWLPDDYPEGQERSGLNPDSAIYSSGPIQRRDQFITRSPFDPPPFNSNNKDINHNSMTSSDDYGVITSNLTDSSSNHRSILLPSPSPSSPPSHHVENKKHLDIKELNHILDGQQGYRLVDPRVLMTEERLTTALAMIDRSLDLMGDELRLPYLLRSCIELGRRLYSRLPKITQVSQSLLSLIESSPEPSSSPLSSRLSDAIFVALDKPNEGDPDNNAHHGSVIHPKPSSSHLLNHNNKNHLHPLNTTKLMNEAMFSVGKEMADWLLELMEKLMELIKQHGGTEEKLAYRIKESISLGMRQMKWDLQRDQQLQGHRITNHQQDYLRALYKGISSGLNERQSNNNEMTTGSAGGGVGGVNGAAKGFKQLSGKVNIIRGLVEPNKIYGVLNMSRIWNGQLFSSVNSPERLIKILATTLRRIKGETRQHDLIEQIMPMVGGKFQPALQEFVKRIVDPRAEGKLGAGDRLNMGTSSNGPVDSVSEETNPYYSSSSLATTSTTMSPNDADNNGDLSGRTGGNKVITSMLEIHDHENKVPALCFVAGRRWRLVLSRGPTMQSRDMIISHLTREINKARGKLELIIGARLSTLCLPRLEAGWKGWGINGEEKGQDVAPISNLNMEENWLELKEMLGENPLMMLNDIKNPFASGAIMGYNLGAKIGYNNARNTTLELERADRINSTQKDILERAGARAGMTEGAKRAFETSLIEGYKIGLKMAPNAGLINTRRAAAKSGLTIGFTMGANFGGVAGRMAGAKAAAIVDDNPEAFKRLQYAQLAGERAGMRSGEIIGASAAMMAASDAYMRMVISRGKLTNVRFLFQEYTNGAKAGFETGLKGGAVAADSVVLQQVAPDELKIEIPKENDFEQQVINNEESQQQGGGGFGSGEYSGDEFEIKMPPSVLEELEARRETKGIHEGRFKGTIKLSFGTETAAAAAAAVAKLGAPSPVSNWPEPESMELEVKASGFATAGTIYSELNGTVSAKGHLKGYLFADLLTPSKKGINVATTKEPEGPTPAGKSPADPKGSSSSSKKPVAPAAKKP